MSDGRDTFGHREGTSGGKCVKMMVKWEKEMKRKPGVKYFEIGPYPVWFGFTTSEEGFRRELKRLKIDPDEADYIPEEAGASTHTIDREGKNKTIIVTLAIEKSDSLSSLCGLAVHEAVHVWDGILDAIRADGSDSEINAYHIQRIAQCMIAEIMKEVERRKENGKDSGTG